MTAVAQNESTTFTPPREPLLRSAAGAFELRAAESDGGMPTLFGHFTRFNEWTEIDSFWEGRFLERISPGAFKKTFKDQAATIRCLFQHGRDPQIGNKPLGPIKIMREEGEGPYYEVPMLDTEYNRDLVPGLKEGLYGASFRMQVLREEIAEEPGRSDHNPDGIPERTIKEIRLFEFGPVTFPAYPNATAGVRSLTDWYLDRGVTEFCRSDPDRFREFVFEQLASDTERLRGLVSFPGIVAGNTITGSANGNTFTVTTTAPASTTPPEAEEARDDAPTEAEDAAEEDRTITTDEQPEAATATEDRDAEDASDDAGADTGSTSSQPKTSTHVYGTRSRKPSWQL